MNPGPDGRQASVGGLALAMVFAMVWPSVLTWLYFVHFAANQGGAYPLQKVAFSVGKVVQFTFPLLFVWITTRHLPRPDRLTKAGLGLGFGFGLLVATVMLGAYFGVLRHRPLLAGTSGSVKAMLEKFGVDTPAAYLVVAVGYVAVHSLLEEYYWRWFVFGGLRRLVPLWSAILLSSLGFMAHHVIVLYVYLPGRFFSAVVPFSLAIAVGGAIWAWMYHRSGSLYGPWLSHLLVDGAIFIIGWDLLQRQAG